MDVKQGLTGHDMGKNHILNLKWTKVVHLIFKNNLCQFSYSF